MKKFIVIVLILIVASFLLNACSSGLFNSEYKKLLRANAMNLCTGINAHNALYPDEAITEIPDLGTLKDVLGEKLYPPNLSDEDAEKALEMIEIVDGKAVWSE